MLDLQFLIDHLDDVARNIASRGMNVDLQPLVALREQRNNLIRRLDESRHQQKELSAQIPKADAATRPGLVEQGRQLREQIAAGEVELKQVEADLRQVQMSIPNMTHPEAPVGPDESHSVVARLVGEKPQFDFKPLDHVELAAKHDLIDFEGGARVAGSGFYFLKNEAVLLELALVQLAVQTLRNRGWTLHITPDLARLDVLEGTGYNPRGPETQIYSISGTDLCLVATAEITLGGTLRDQILDVARLPLRFAGLSHCFRTEAGAAGRASRGIYRVHQFTKVEMFAFTAPDLAESDRMHAEIVAIEEEIFQKLGIHYRVLDTCTGDLGASAFRKFDLEAWMPGRGDGGEYGEVTSASNCTDYQSRRLSIRCKEPDRKGTQFVHTLNGTCIAVSRALIAVLENYQQADGSIRIPEVLRPWVGCDQIG